MPVQRLAVHLPSPLLLLAGHPPQLHLVQRAAVPHLVALRAEVDVLVGGEGETVRAPAAFPRELGLEYLTE